jgi:hypothetical protein
MVKRLTDKDFCKRCGTMLTVIGSCPKFDCPTHDEEKRR